MKHLLYILFSISVLVFGACRKMDHAPVITLLGKNPAETGKGYPYKDAGATAFDEEDGDITSRIIIISNVDTGTIGSYKVTYRVADNDGNEAKEVVRDVIVKYFK